MVQLVKVPGTGRQTLCVSSSVLALSIPELILNTCCSSGAGSIVFLGEEMTGKWIE